MNPVFLISSASTRVFFFGFHSYVIGSSEILLHPRPPRPRRNAWATHPIGGGILTRTNPGLKFSAFTPQIGPTNTISPKKKSALHFQDSAKIPSVFDYLLPCRQVPRERQQYPRGIWRTINRNCNPGETTTCSRQDHANLFVPGGCFRSVHHTLHDIERVRTGTNRFFSGARDGWIQIGENEL